MATFAFERGEARYRADIGDVMRFLREGDSYEVCLTNQLRCVSHAPPPLKLYHTLFELNPAPHAAYLRIDPYRLIGSGGGGDGGGGGANRGSSGLGPGGVALCSSSPERFLRVTRDGHVECKPIKGTAPRGKTAEEDAARAAALRGGVKDRAENLMIVDLIRNDLSRVCSVGSVRVPSLMAIETFASVHQLVSTVAGDLLPSVHALDAVGAAFPPGSMTGAPKVRTMRLIDELEAHVPRGAYSGTLGYFSIDGAADLNVVIRTAAVDEAGVSIGAGGAITVLSDAADEWGEVLLKARNVVRAVAQCACGSADAYQIVDQPPPPPLPTSGTTPAPRARRRARRRARPLAAPAVAAAGTGGAHLVETYLHTPSEGFFLWEAHRDRLVASARSLGFLRGSGCDADEESARRRLDAHLRAELDACAATWPREEASRVRLLLGKDGALRVVRAPLSSSAAFTHPPTHLDESVLEAAPLYSARLDRQPISSADVRLLHKSSEREAYERARERVGLAAAVGAPPPPLCDVLMYNEADELTECSIANVALEDADGRWRTPPTDCGLLAGTMRAELLASGALYEGVVTLEELREAVRTGRRLIAFNAVRGVYRLRVEESRGAMASASLHSRL